MGMLSWIKTGKWSPTQASAPAPAPAAPLAAPAEGITVLDFTSDEYKRMVEQVMRGERAAPSLEALYEQLVDVAEEGLEWQRSSGTTHLAVDYPQYNRFRDLGMLIHQEGGHKGMQRACLMLRQRGGFDLAWTVETSWKGIGGWWP